MNTSMISIIIPCYKQAHLLSETLDSVLSQTYANWECIIVNDGSPDNTEEIAQKYCDKDNRIKLLNQQNQGLAMARNNGIKLSKGEYILPLDSDDLIEPTYIEKAIDHFEKNPDTKLVYCEADRFDQKKEKWNLPEYKYENEIWENCIFCSSIYRREDYDKTIGYNPNMKGGYEDWDFWLSLLKKDSIVYRIPEVLFHYRYQKKSMLMDTEKKKERLCEQLFNNHQEIYAEYITKLVYYVNENINLKKRDKFYIVTIVKIITKKICSFFTN